VKKLKNKKMALIVFKVSNYFILGAFNCKSKKIIKTKSERSGFEFSLPETLDFFIKLIIFIMFLMCAVFKLGLTAIFSLFKHRI